ncbi:MAG TPA: peptide ABC transporter substrate-binding protein [Pyrinomonadaceae bacterium]|nr:peptide ABC transporter substrate-binding protein [Pyrinomonadaceae bacterium]
MKRARLITLHLGFAITVACLVTGCTSSAKNQFFGQTVAPSENALRYVTGSEPESLDPIVPNGQPEARILMALYDGLIEYHPVTLDPIPGVAESWEITEGGTEYVFHLRKNAKFSNGDPITANDFVYSFRRGFKPELASRNASLGYYIKYSEAYNSGFAFVKGADGKFLLKKDFVEMVEAASPQAATPSGDSAFHKFLDEPERLSVPTSEKDRQKLLDSDPKLKAALDGKELVPVKAEDIGVEAVDDYTLRIKLYQPAPYFMGLLGHQFFRVVDQKVVEKLGERWSRPENIVTSGSFKVLEHRPYDKLVVVKDPQNWDAANVKLDRIEFYPLDEQTTMMNLYKSGRVDAIYNHTVPAPWFDDVSRYKDEYLLHPENASEFYVINVKKPPMDNQKVREAFALAVDRGAFEKLRRTYKPLVDFVPFGIFPKYEEARDKVYSEELKKQGSSLDEWKARKFNPEKARKLMTEAGFPVQQSGSGFSCPTFPVESVSITYNTSESNKSTAEFAQAQWKQNLGITVPIKNMEFKTFLPLLNKVDYEGFGRRGWVGDYMDPYTFLYLFYSPNNTGATGWWDPKFDRMLDEANNTVDSQQRYEKLAAAELYMMQKQIVIPLGVPGTSWLKKPYVKGLYPNPGTLHPWKFVYIERDPAKWDHDVDNMMSEKNPIVEDQAAAIMRTQEEFLKSKPADGKTAPVE